MWALNGSAFIISLALARQGRTEEAALLAEGHHERHAWIGTTDAVYRGMALSIACAACGRQGEALAHAHEAAQDARSTDSNLYQSLCAGAPRSAQHSTDRQLRWHIRRPAVTLQVRAARVCRRLRK